jgi:putative phosphotransacetylase
MSNMQVIIEGSGKHCHVTRETLDVLFGMDFELEVRKNLSQPGQYATTQKGYGCRAKGPDDHVDPRPVPQRRSGELSFTDARALGLDCPVRESGDVKGERPLQAHRSERRGGPERRRNSSRKRHIHLTRDAERMGISDQDIVQV